VGGYSRGNGFQTEMPGLRPFDYGTQKNGREKLQGNPKTGIRKREKREKNGEKSPCTLT
jgi:hypothetical protein